MLILMINLKDLRQCFTFCIEHEGWPGNMAISLTQHEILVAWIERSVSWTRMWWILDGGSVGVFFFLGSVNILTFVPNLWCKATHVTWCWVCSWMNWINYECDVDKDIAEMTMGTWLEKNLRTQSSYTFLLEFMWHACLLACFRCEFSDAKVHVIDVTEYLSQEVGVVDSVPHGMESPENKQPTSCLDEKMWCAVACLGCFFWCFNWCQLMCLKRLFGLYQEKG